MAYMIKQRWDFEKTYEDYNEAVAAAKIESLKEGHKIVVYSEDAEIDSAPIHPAAIMATVKRL